MGCCGQKRAALRRRVGAPPRQLVAPPPPSVPEVVPDGTTVVEYRGDSPILASVSTGRLYTFSPGRRLAAVPPADAGQLLRNPLFRLHERRSNGTSQEGS
jgi:hypothetical protein